MDGEQTIYHGPGRLTVSDLVGGVILSLLLIGIPILLWKWFETSRRIYTISTTGIRVESGLITRRTEMLELYRIRDMRLDSTLGRDTVIVFSNDTTTPELRMTIPNGRAVFESLRQGLQSARQRAGIVQYQT